MIQSTGAESSTFTRPVLLTTGVSSNAMPLKRILGRKYRPLVTQAARSTKKDFLAHLTEAGAYKIKRRLQLDPGQFWRAAKGRDFLDLPPAPVQLMLFPEFADI